MAYTPLLSTTTLGAAITNTQTRITVASTTGMVTTAGPAGTGTVLWVGNERLNILNVVNTTTLDVERGTGGTAAQYHANSTTVTIGLPSAFGDLVPQAPGIPTLTAAASTAGLPSFVVLPGISRMDPNTGYVYTQVNCNQAMSVGEVVAIDNAGVAGPITATAKGRVGIVAEAVAASQTLTWVLTSGSTSSALMTSDVTTACILMAGSSGQFDLLTSTGGNIVYGATCTAAPSSATDLGTVYLHNAWVFGVTASFSSVGG